MGLINYTFRHCAAIAVIFASPLVWSEEVVNFNTAPAPSQESLELPANIKLNLMHYDEKQYQLAYEVFVMNGNVGYAYTIAKAAVKHNPDDLVWREKLAKVALWSGNAYAALQQWMFFITHDKDADQYVGQAYVLAGQLNDYDAQAEITRLKLQKEPDSKPLLLQYVTLMQNQGFPEEALSYLKKIPGAENDVDFLEQFAAINKGLDLPEPELYYLSRLVPLQKNSTVSGERAAEILYSKGDLTGAYDVYQLLSQKVIKHTDKFWQSYAAIALLAGKKLAVIEAYEHLLDDGNINQSQILQLIFLQQTDKKFAVAYQQAKKAYKKYHFNILIETIVSLGDQLKKWPEVNDFVDKLSPQQLFKLKSKPSYAILLANLDMHLGNRVQAYKDWIAILQRWPNLTLVQENYLWFLLDNNDYQQIDYLLKRWCKVFAEKSVLWLPYVAALSETGHYQQALAVSLQHQNNKSYEVLSTLAELLIQNNYPYEAYYTGQKAFYLISRQARRQPGNLTLAQKLRLTELAQNYAPVSFSYNLVINLQKDLFKIPEVDNQIVSFALKHNRYSLASYITSIHRQQKTYTPPWMTLTLALVYNDRQAMQYLLTHSPNRLPYRDRVTAAVLTGNSKLAQEYAFKGLKDHPHDQEMYKLFQQTMLPASNRFSVGGYEKTVGTVTGPETTASARFFIDPSLSIVPYDILWWPRINDKTQLAWSPYIDRTIGFRLRKKTRRGWLQVDLAERKSLENIFIIKGKWQYQYSAKTNLMASVGFHETANESTPLLIAGMKNEAMLSITQLLDSYNTIDAQVAIDGFYGQENTFLGSGEVARGHWQHKFYLTYPDWNVNLYGTMANFKSQNSVLPSKLQQLIPSTITPSVGFYVPISYKEVGATVGLGQQYKNSYTHDWKAFFEVGYLYSAAFGLGSLAQGGIATSVFGRDHLILYGEFSKNQQQAQKNYLIGMRYDIYF